MHIGLIEVFTLLLLFGGLAVSTERLAAFWGSECMGTPYRNYAEILTPMRRCLQRLGRRMATVTRWSPIGYI